MSLLDKASLYIAAFAVGSVGLGCLKGFLAIAAFGSTALSPYGSSPRAVSPASPHQSTIAGER